MLKHKIGKKKNTTQLKNKSLIINGEIIFFKKNIKGWKYIK